jgi:hypothetical protein
MIVSNRGAGKGARLERGIVSKEQQRAGSYRFTAFASPNQRQLTRETLNRPRAIDELSRRTLAQNS